ncbi:cobalt ABC transporter permease [Terasakiella sp. SH-1]|uniref:cobalt ABC transporter permease n=1 Tax=Terasakiella sp. SH-1 TaxID=2560057 RepID=UPI001073D2DD|nr:cobalt ABC transporter permease [Terasakiella sp. SH-1]
MPKFLPFLAFLLLCSPVHAHKIVASAWTDGNDIEGEIGMSNGDMAKSGTLIKVLDLEGHQIGKTTVGKDGLFRFTPTKAVAHRFEANLGAGHVAFVIVGVDELPDSLKQPEKASPTQASTPPQLVSADLEKIIAKAVRDEIQPLRKEIAAYKEKNDLQTILGGIGYILGLTGIGFYMAARRQNGKQE